MANELTFTDADSGASQTAKIGQAITIRLRENPSTGYQWTLDADPAGAVELVGSEYHTGGSAPGTPGVREFRLQGKATGRVRLQLRLSRSWEGEGSAVERREFTLQIAP